MSGLFPDFNAASATRDTAVPAAHGHAQRPAGPAGVAPEAVIAGPARHRVSESANHHDEQERRYKRFVNQGMVTP
ncbi:hypothetical protein SHTP_1730 [Mycobacterium ulcerans subsp. shinshuense]|uniref:Uncharacterized protein n=1 Tax=Mycobacterium ulcerans subsp. shinshuense TaxID=1124626 RepID=A0A1B4Y1M4_MYCUL|nr:hypothetical protein SHTP_1730 [Mycobacterium ulcerans subsp. shinshuense]